MTSWEEYIKSNILDYRENLERLPEEDRELILKGEGDLSFSLYKPCQVVVINFEDYPDYFIVLHSEKHPDMKIEVLENVVLEDFSPQALREIGLLDWLSLEEISKVAEFLTSAALSDAEGKHPIAFNEAFMGKVRSFMYRKDIRTAERSNELSFWVTDFVDFVLREALRNEQRQKIEETVDSLREDVQAIPETIELRNKILENTQRLESQMEELNKKVDEDIQEIRRLVGRSKEFLDWKAFSTDVEHLKETHITKDTFDVHIKRLDEKIDSGIKSLNTRIEDLKAVKFWSKRTILEIALVIWGTIVTLYAAGILKF